MANLPSKSRAKRGAASAAIPQNGSSPRVIGRPVFAQPEPTPDPTKFIVKHVSDKEAYATIDELNKEGKIAATPFPVPRGLPEPRLTLAQVLGVDEAALDQRFPANNQIVFHALGDTGSTRGPESQNKVTDKMVSDFADEGNQKPAFCFHLGDVVYSFGERAYYYDQFYEPYREYPAPIVALAGNHDGMVAPGSNATTLAAFLDNFCSTKSEALPEAGGLSRTTQLQPGVFFTFEAPFVRVLALYSNTLEDPGVIANDAIGQSQIAYLRAALARVKAENFEGALIFAHHHPVYTHGSQHGPSGEMLSQIDAECDKAGVWPHAVLSGHAHNFQRFTRLHGGKQIPYYVSGNGGHGLTKLTRKSTGALRTPLVLDKVPGQTDTVTLENYDDRDYGYLRIVVTKSLLRIEYHPASDGAEAKTPDDVVTVDLATRKFAPGA